MMARGAADQQSWEGQRSNKRMGYKVDSVDLPAFVVVVVVEEEEVCERVPGKRRG